MTCGGAVPTIRSVCDVRAWKCSIAGRSGAVMTRMEANTLNLQARTSSGLGSLPHSRHHNVLECLTQRLRAVAHGPLRSLNGARPRPQPPGHFLTELAELDDTVGKLEAGQVDGGRNAWHFFCHNVQRVVDAPRGLSQLLQQRSTRSK